MTYTIPKNKLTFYVDYVIHNNRCYVLQETKDDILKVCKKNELERKKENIKNPF